MTLQSPRSSRTPWEPGRQILRVEYAVVGLLHVAGDSTAPALMPARCAVRTGNIYFGGRTRPLLRVSRFPRALQPPWRSPVTAERLERLAKCSSFLYCSPEGRVSPSFVVLSISRFPATCLVTGDLRSPSSPSFACLRAD